MRKKIFQSIVTVALTVLMASIIIATSFLHYYFNYTQEEQLKEELSLVTNKVETLGEEYLDNFTSSVFRFTLVAEDGAVLYDTKANAAEMENHGERTEIKQALQTGYGNSARYSSTLTQKTLYEAVRLSGGEVLRISTSQVTMGALILGMIPGVAAILLIALVVSFFLSGRMAKNIIEPLNQLDLEHPMQNHSYEELAPMLHKIHRQHKQIDKHLKTLQRKADEFEQITSAMSEGLIVLDDQGMVLSMNRSAYEMFGVLENQMGNDFLTIDRNFEMNRAVKEAFGGKRGDLRMQKKGREYQLTITPIVSGGKILGTVILGFDITERVQAEQNRQEFTANVSHELKTPLQTIIGSAELLENGLVKEEDTNRFVTNIKKEATRLVDLIEDIIQLSRLDEAAEEPVEKVDINEVAEEVVLALTDFAATRKVHLSIVGTECIAYGIRRYIYEMIYNLCDNAIRYNVEDGQVKIALTKEGSCIKISVEDTGIGIPLEHQGKVFERFYRVDKSHSKESGGTGLGLSIVKHAVARHGGKIELESEEGAGTKIVIVI